MSLERLGFIFNGACDFYGFVFDDLFLPLYLGVCLLFVV